MERVSRKKMNYHNKKFKPIKVSENSEVSASTIFHYKQENNIISCEYSGDKIVKGQLIGIVDKNGCINIRYHQINSNGELMTGICFSTPKKLSNGKIRLYEKWEWTSGSYSKGTSIIEELS